MIRMYFRKEKDKYRHIKRKGIKTTDELLDFIADLDDNDKLVTYGAVNNQAYYEDEVMEGIFVHTGGYRMEKQEFTDPFDFPDGFYTTTVYVADEENGNLCLELISAALVKFGDGQNLISTVAELRGILKKIREKNVMECPILSRDDNFELKGAVTNNTYLDVYEEIAGGRRYVGLEMKYY